MCVYVGSIKQEDKENLLEFGDQQSKYVEMGPLALCVCDCVSYCLCAQCQ